MWKKIAIAQLILIVALVAFIAGKEARALVPATATEFVTWNQQGDVVHIWGYYSDKKQWTVSRIDFASASYVEKDISVKPGFKY
ncbi:MAG: hypothetical protein HY801_12465 [Candidatus Lindowbacteria bacterium]|nr:hypothetical protein [Candidatus Lindowbacteria bacterium]